MEHLIQKQPPPQGINKVFWHVAGNGEQITSCSPFKHADPFGSLDILIVGPSYKSARLGFGKGELELKIWEKRFELKIKYSALKC